MAVTSPIPLAVKKLMRQALQDAFWDKPDSRLPRLETYSIDTVAELVNGYFQQEGRQFRTYCKYYNGPLARRGPPRLSVFCCSSDVELHRFRLVVQIREEPVPDEKLQLLLIGQRGRG